MQHSAIPMMRLRRSSSPSGSTASEVHSGRHSWRSSKSIFIASAVLTLMIVVAIVIAVVTQAWSAKTSASIPTSAWLPWTERVNDSRLPRILLWESAAAPEILGANTSQAVIHLKSSGTLHCILGSTEDNVCAVTTQHRRAQESDALLFHGENITASLLPTFRSPGQLWVFWATTHFPPALSYDNLSKISGLFNWTMGRRDDADVTIPYKTWRCGGRGQVNRSREKQEVNTQKWQYRKDAAWITGYCERKTLFKVSDSLKAHSIGNRESNGAIRVHSFPACGISHCGSRRECVRYIAQHYHFIIVSGIPECFQSAADLVYDAFEHNVVPVVLQAKSWNKFPRKSIISSSTMRNPGELAAYLRTLIDNPKLYNQYFAWKNTCKVAEPRSDSLCHLCRALHGKPFRGRHSNVLDWWRQPRNCTHALSPILKTSLFVHDE